MGKPSQLSAATLGVFRGRAAVALGVSRNQLTALLREGVIARELPDMYRMTAVPPFQRAAATRRVDMGRRRRGGRGPLGR